VDLGPSGASGPSGAGGEGLCISSLLPGICLALGFFGAGLLDGLGKNDV